MSVRKISERRYEVQARDATGSNRKRVFETSREARIFDRELADERKQAREDGRQPRTATITLSGYIDTFIDSHVASPATVETLAYRLLIPRKTLGSILLRDLDREKIGRWTKDELSDYSPTTQRGVLKALRQVLSQAVRDELLRSNPASEVRLPALSRPPIKPFRSWDEVELVASHAGQYGPLIRFAARTGLRPQEWQALRVRDLDAPHKRLTVNQTVRSGRIAPMAAKTSGSHRTIVLSRHALSALTDHPMPDDPDALIFGTRDGSVMNLHTFRTRPWYAALDAAKLQRRGSVQLRHTFATLSLAGDPPVPINLVSRMLGHSDISTTLRFYAAYLPELDEQLLRILDAGR